MKTALKIPTEERLVEVLRKEIKTKAKAKRLAKELLSLANELLSSEQKLGENVVFRTSADCRRGIQSCEFLKDIFKKYRSPSVVGDRLEQALGIRARLDTLDEWIRDFRKNSRRVKPFDWTISQIGAFLDQLEQHFEITTSTKSPTLAEAVVALFYPRLKSETVSRYIKKWRKSRRLILGKRDW